MLYEVITDRLRCELGVEDTGTPDAAAGNIKSFDPAQTASYNFV